MLLSKALYGFMEWVSRKPELCSGINAKKFKYETAPL